MDSPIVVPPMLYLPVFDHPEGGKFAVIRKLTDGRIGSGAKWLYEAWAPLDVRESIDDFFRHPPALVNEATGTWAVGTR